MLLRLPRAVVSLGAALCVSAAAAVAPGAAAAEGPTPQAIDAHAEFLAYAPPPPVPVKVCVVDTGIDLSTDAAPAIVERHSVFGGTGDDVGGSGMSKHGTFVAGVIASQLDGRDSVGIWPQARIVSVRVFEGATQATRVASVIAALQRCRERGARVVNLSISGLDTATGEELAELENRVTAITEVRDIVVVAGAGNNGGEVGYPARFPSVIAAGAASSDGALCPFSNRGAALDVTALGCDVEVSWPSGGTGSGSGTSYSAPVVSAVVAALRGYRPDLSARAVMNLLAPARGDRLDATRAFLLAGLGALTEAGTPSSSAPSPEAPQSSSISPVRHLRPLDQLAVRAPHVREASFRRGLLIVRIAPFPDYGRAVFRVDGRTLVRAGTTLRVRLGRAPKRAAVAIDVAGVGRTSYAPIRLRVRKATPGVKVGTKRVELGTRRN